MNQSISLALVGMVAALPVTALAACPGGSTTHCSSSPTTPTFECTLPTASERSEAYFWLDSGDICVEFMDGGTLVANGVLDPSTLMVPPSRSQALMLRVTGTSGFDLIQFWNPARSVSLGDPTGFGLQVWAYGGDGDDEIIGGDGDVFNYQENLFGGDGNDELSTDNGWDRVEGGDGDDRIEGGLLPQNIIGGDGNDVIWGRGDRDDIEGDDSHVTSASGNDKINGGDEHDYIYGGPGADQLCGDDHAVLTGTNPHNEWLFGESGTDCLAAGTGGPPGGPGLDQVIDCGGGTDTYQTGSYSTPIDCETADTSGISYCDDSTW